jgi:probable phosphoglycerate mutase
MLSARLLLVRHGQSTFNAQARLQGQADPPLSEAGRREAELLAPALARFEDGRVITSDLRRARETAALLGYPDALPDPRWREIDVGAWAGRPLSEFPGGSEPAWRGGPLHASDGETWDELQARVGDAVDELIAAGGSWLVICHGGVVRAALSHVTGADPQRVAGPANASVTVVRTGSPARLDAYGWTPDGLAQSGF